LSRGSQTTSSSGSSTRTTLRVPGGTARKAREIQPGTAPRQDLADRIRAARGPDAESAGRGEAADVHVPGIPAHRPDDQAGTVLGTADHGQEEDDGQAEVGESRADAPPPFARPRAGKMAGQRDQGTRGVLRRPRQRGGSAGIPVPRHPALAVHTVASQPERPGHLGADVPAWPGATGQRPGSGTPGPKRGSPPDTHDRSQCGNPARWDLRGGPPAMAVPTATIWRTPSR
jgi:hypothetical protein